MWEPNRCQIHTDVREYQFRSQTNVKAIPMYEPYQCRGHTSVGAKPMSEHSNVRAIPMSEHTNVKAIPMYEPYHCRSQTDVRAFQCPSQCCVQPLVASTHFWTEQTTPTRRIAMYSIQSTDCHAHIALLIKKLIDKI